MRESAVRGPAIELDEFERRLRVGAGRSNVNPGAARTSPDSEKTDPLEELARIIRGDRLNAPGAGAVHPPEPPIAPHPAVAAASARAYPSPPMVAAGSRAERAPPPIAPPMAWTRHATDIDTDHTETHYADAADLRGSYSADYPTEADYAGAVDDDPYAPAIGGYDDARVREPSMRERGYGDAVAHPGDYPDYAEPTYGEAETGWPETDAYDYAYEEAPPSPPAPSRGLSAIGGRLKPWHAIAAISVLAVVSVGWGVTHRMGGGSREIALIPPPEGPLKIQPSAETGKEAPGPGGTAVLDRKESAPVRQIVTRQEQAVDPSVPQDVLQIGAGPVEAPHEPPPTSVTQPRRVKTVAVRPEAPPAIRQTAPASEPTTRAAAPTPAAPTPAPARPAAKAAPAPTQTASAPAPASSSAAAGAYAVQFGAAGSEAEARALIKTVSDKYGAALGGRKLSIKAATIGEKKVFRVRIAGLAKDAAESICGRVKAGGGACFVAGN